MRFWSVDACSQVLLASLLAFLFLGKQSLWFDEINSVLFSETLFSNTALFVQEGETNMFFYYLLLHLWMKVGETEFWIRSLSVFFAVASVPMIFALGSRLFGTRVGMLAALLLSFSPFFVQVAREARSYSLLLFLVILNFYFFVRSVQKPSIVNWTAYTVVSALAVYSHFLAGLVTLAEVFSLSFLPLRRIPWRGLVASGIGMAILLLPLAVTVILGPSAYIAAGPFGPIHVLLTAEHSLSTLAGGHGLAISYSFLLLLSFWAMRENLIREAQALQGWSFALPVLGFTGPLLATIIVALVEKRFLTPRYLTMCLPSLLLLVAYGLNRMRAKWLQVAAVMVLFSLAVPPLHHYYRHGKKEDWRSAAQFVASKANAGDGVIFVAYMVGPSFEYLL